MRQLIIRLQYLYDDSVRRKHGRLFCIVGSGYILDLPIICLLIKELIFFSKPFRSSVEEEGTVLLEVPIESSSTMTHVEISRTTEGSINKIRDYLLRSETNNECLQMAVKAVNDIIGSEGLFPTLLVYDTLPRPLWKTPAETQIRTAESLNSAMKEVQQEQ